MNYDVNKENLSVLNTVFDGCKEIPIDIDFTLPDYCPDIQKILKCAVKPGINFRNISGDQINIEGNAEIKIIYIDSDSSKLRFCENSVPFSTSLDIKNNPENAVVNTRLKTEYMNCRAVSPRKVDLHGAISVCAKVNEKQSLDVTSCINGKDIEQKIEKLDVSDLISIGQQQFSIEEMLELDDNMPEPEMIISSDVIFLSDEPKIMPNKVVVKGTALLKITYIDDLTSGTTQSLNYEIPISQIVDVPGITDQCECLIKTEILNDKIQISGNDKSENSKSLISAVIKAAATVFAFLNKEIDLVSDVYSREYNTQINKEQFNAKKIIKSFKEEFSYQNTVDTPIENIKDIISIQPSLSNVQTISENGKITLKGKIKLNILASDSENMPAYTERTIDFEKQLAQEIEQENIQFEAELLPLGVVVNSITNDGKIDFKMNILAYITAYTESKQDMVVEVTSDESRPEDKLSKASLTVYFADKNESLWDIAQKFYSSVESIKEENSISEEIIDEPKMILIPSK